MHIRADNISDLLAMLLYGIEQIQKARDILSHWLLIDAWTLSFQILIALFSCDGRP